jgi:hypothetical protein
MVTKEKTMKRALQLFATLFLLGMITGCETDTQTAQSTATTAPGENVASQGNRLDVSEEVSKAEDEKIYDQEISDLEKANADAEIKTDEGDDTIAGTVTITPKAGWYMRTIISATLPDGTTYTHKSAGVFGELDESNRRRDQHDIESYGKAVLQTTFVNNQVHISKEYFSDYREYSETGTKQVWTFLVKNDLAPDLSHADLNISVDDVRDVYKKPGQRFYSETVSSDQSKRDALILVDVDNRKTYSYEELKNTTLSMDGKRVRTFRWVLNGSVSSDDMKPRKVIDVLSSGNKASSAPMQVSEQSTSKFGLPPSL